MSGWLAMFTGWIDGQETKKVDDRYRLKRGEMMSLGFGRNANVIGRGLGGPRSTVVRLFGGSRTGLPNGGHR